MIFHVFKLIWNRKRTNFLMVLEIFVSFIVLFAVVGLGVYTLDNWRRPIGFSVDNIWNIDVDMKQTSDDYFDEKQSESIRQVMLALKEFPEIENTAGTMLAPYQFGSSSSSYDWRGRQIEFGVTEATDGFQDLLRLQVVEGRWFGAEDKGQNYTPVVINQNMREDLFGSGPAIGQNLEADRRPGEEGRPNRPTPGQPPSAPELHRRIVGVVASYREDGEFDGTRNYAIFRKDLDVAGKADRRDRPPRNILIRVQPGTTAALQERLIKRLQAAAPDWSFEVTPLSEMRSTAIQFAVVPLIGVGLVAAFLMLMVALGLLGVLWQSVTQRTREIGLRRAKGAARVNVRRQILGEIAVMTTLALIAGVLVAIQFPLLDIIYFVEPHVYAISLAISVTAIYLLTLACGWYPSRMATRVEPAEALRYE
jgi:putative ABC transport system permease protein